MTLEHFFAVRVLDSAADSDKTTKAVFDALVSALHPFNVDPALDYSCELVALRQDQPCHTGSPWSLIREGFRQAWKAGR